ncbi:unnamed protein product [Clonostachys rosea f. rosea IK726]|uniref:Zinc/iron permease n=2 Tax=Bionectria ochroleuca TaxID=29856 RepID=A0A0B7JW90_BIOOC|nr:unnamed protein product [Clonostachys rosea f. rosea IK726]
MSAKTCLTLALCGLAMADLVPRQTQAPTTTAQAQVTAITGCHLHASDLYCFAGTAEYKIKTTVTATTSLPAQYTDCHSHGASFYCVDESGEDVQAESESGSEETEETHEHEEEETTNNNQHCHFHAGVEHCTGGSEEEESSGSSSGSSSSSSCTTTSRDYNIGLRVGLLFVILATSSLGVFGPILMHKLFQNKLNLLFVGLKQFGTGIILSTAFIHLYTHASMMFSNDCVGELEYEGVTSAIVMAGIFLSFLVEYVGHRIVQAKIRSEAALGTQERSKALISSEVVSITVMEAGILFHSLLIGLTLVVAGDSFFLTLFVVILFHQVFEGLALGTRIATIGTRDDPELHPVESGGVLGDERKSAQAESSSETSETVPVGLSMKKKLLLASCFAFITPIGMAIGIGVLKQFNGNDKSTLIAIGTLDALSAGMLVWVGLVEMWAADWVTGSHGRKAELADANVITTCVAFFGLISGLVLMSVLGKWA